MSLALSGVALSALAHSQRFRERESRELMGIAVATCRADYCGIAILTVSPSVTVDGTLTRPPLATRPASHTTRFRLFITLGGVHAQVTSFYAPVYYGFLEHPRAQLFYLVTTTAFGALHAAPILRPVPPPPSAAHVARRGAGVMDSVHDIVCSVATAGLVCTAVTLMEFFQSYKYRPLRAAVFVALGAPPPPGVLLALKPLPHMADSRALWPSLPDG